MATIIISLSVITAPRFIDRSRETFEYRTSPPRIISDFSSRYYYTRRSHCRNHGTCMLSIRTPCMTVADVGQRGNRSWGSVRVVDSWPSKRRSTLLCSYHAISCCPLESGPRASFLASFTVCKLYLHLCRSLSLCSSLFSNLETRIDVRSSLRFHSEDSRRGLKLLDQIKTRGERNHGWLANISTPCMSTRSAGNAGFAATIPTRHGNYSGNTVLPCAALRSPWMGWILNSQRPRENGRSLDNCHVRRGSLVVLIDPLFAP